MSWFVLVIPLSFSFVVQFLLWFNVLFPYNFLFDNFDRNLYLAFSLSGLFGAGISIVFFKLIALEETNKAIIIAAIIFQVLCFLSCLFFFLSSLTGWLLF
ncbi:hypothetical protein R83H12_01297 [Fibrobacteria bacterium R8-3-H12]